MDTVRTDLPPRGSVNFICLLPLLWLQHFGLLFVSAHLHFIMANSKSIIITGASRGIGLAIAKFLLRESHKVFLVARTAAPLEKLKSEFPGQVEFFAGDLKDFEVGVN
jgi:hypothetical protein